MRKLNMIKQFPRFFLHLPAGFFAMSYAEQESAAVAMWRDAMIQLGKDPDRLVSEAPPVSTPSAPANG